MDASIPVEFIVCPHAKRVVFVRPAEPWCLLLPVLATEALQEKAMPHVTWCVDKIASVYHHPTGMYTLPLQVDAEPDFQRELAQVEEQLVQIILAKSRAWFGGRQVERQHIRPMLLLQGRQLCVKVRPGVSVIDLATQTPLARSALASPVRMAGSIECTGIWWTKNTVRIVWHLQEAILVETVGSQKN